MKYRILIIVFAELIFHYDPVIAQDDINWKFQQYIDNNVDTVYAYEYNVHKRRKKQPDSLLVFRQVVMAQERKLVTEYYKFEGFVNHKLWRRRTEIFDDFGHLVNYLDEPFDPIKSSNFKDSIYHLYIGESIQNLFHDTLLIQELKFNIHRLYEFDKSSDTTINSSFYPEIRKNIYDDYGRIIKVHFSLDSAISIITKGNKVLEEFKFEPKEEFNITGYFKQKIEYFDDGRLKKNYSFFPNGDLEKSTTYSYDEKFRLVEARDSITSQNNEFAFITRRTEYYDWGTSELTTYEGGWRDGDLVKMCFDKNGRIISYESGTADQDVFKYFYEYTYDRQILRRSTMTEMAVQAIAGGTSETIILYNELGLPISKTKGGWYKKRYFYR